MEHQRVWVRRLQKHKFTSYRVNNQPPAQKIRTTDIAFRHVFFLIVFVILAALYYYNFSRFPRSSDDANVFLAGHEMSEGNWRLKGWWLPDDNFLTIDIPLYAVFVKCLGLTPYTMFYLPAMMWAGVALLSAALAQDGLPEFQKAAAVAAVTTPIMLPILRNNGFMDQVAHVWAHSGTILYVLLCFLLAKMAISRVGARSVSILTAYTLIMFLAVFGDTLAIFIGAMPIIALATFSALFGHKPGPNRLLLILTLLATVLGKTLVELNSRTGGFQLFHLPIKFVRFDDLGKNVASVCQYFFNLFGCDFFDKYLLPFSTSGPALSLIRLPFLALLIVALVAVGQRLLLSIKENEAQWLSHEGEYLNALLAIAFTMNVAAAVFSDRISDAAAIRYFFPALVFGAILIARTQTGPRWLRAYYFLGLFASLAFSLAAYAQSPREATLTSKEIETLSNWLSKNNLTYGFGPYWSSSIVTAATENQIKIRALIADAEMGLKPFKWEANKKWYRFKPTSGARPIFVLAHQEEANFYRETDVLRTLGEPLDKHEVGSYTINLYDSTDPRLRTLFPSSTAVR